MKGVILALFTLSMVGIVRSVNTVIILGVWGGNVNGYACVDVPASGVTCGWQVEIYLYPKVTVLDVYDGVNLANYDNIFIVKNQYYNAQINTNDLCLSFTGSNPAITYPQEPNITARFVCTCTSSSSDCNSFATPQATTTTLPLSTTSSPPSTTSDPPSTTSDPPSTTSLASIDNTDTAFRIFKTNYKIFTELPARDNSYFKALDIVDCAFGCTKKPGCVAFSYATENCLLVDGSRCITVNMLYYRHGWETWFRNGTVSDSVSCQNTT